MDCLPQDLMPRNAGRKTACQPAYSDTLFHCSFRQPVELLASRPDAQNYLLPSTVCQRGVLGGALPFLVRLAPWSCPPQDLMPRNAGQGCLPTRVLGMPPFHSSLGYACAPSFKVRAVHTTAHSRFAGLLRRAAPASFAFVRPVARRGDRSRTPVARHAGRAAAASNSCTLRAAARPAAGAGRRECATLCVPWCERLSVRPPKATTP